MQQIYLPKNIYKLADYACKQEILGNDIKERKKLLGDWELLKSRSVPDKEISKITGISRSTYYRNKKLISKYGIHGLKRRSKRPKKLRQSKIPDKVRKLILDIRRANPTYGKFKIHRILIRDHGISISESSVGRILSYLLSKGLISRSKSSIREKRKRSFTSHAKKWSYGMRGKKPGELIQIDHMTVTKNNITMKHFQAWDPRTKMIVAQVYTNASSNVAAMFLDKVIKDMPFWIKSIQVDGGSEFMSYFEEKCKNNNIDLYVLPPRSPKYNGGVERGNRIFREEFYSRKDVLANSVGEFKYLLQQAVDKYNNYRPHFSLKGLTPFEYNNQLKEVS